MSLTTTMDHQHQSLSASGASPTYDGSRRRLDSLPLSVSPCNSSGTSDTADDRSPTVVVDTSPIETYGHYKRRLDCSPLALSPCSSSSSTYDTGDDRSPTVVDPSPTDTWLPKRKSSYAPPPLPETATSLELTGTALFDDIRERFRTGISTLDNLLRYMEHCGPARCRGYRRGVDSLLENLVAMAKWLVGYLETTRAADNDAGWTRSAVVGLRVDLHQYSSKVMKLTKLLRQVGVYDTPVVQF